MSNRIQDLLQKEQLTKEDLLTILSISDPSEAQLIFDAAKNLKTSITGNKIYYRGIIEFSNICSKDCYYCGIRKSNPFVDRYKMEPEEIVKEALWAHQAGYGSIVIQGGEIQSPVFTNYIEAVLNEIKDKCNGELGITLSLGEQPIETYERWFTAGAHRYLLRIETSNKELYKTLHPKDHLWEVRIQALRDLRKCGYQVGTGVMIGLPGQSIEDLANDIVFFREIDIDMIGMGPFIPHNETPLASIEASFDSEKQLFLGLKMIAATRLFLKDVNIASTTALQALSPIGREKGIEAGANIIMPNLTDTLYRSSYQLYNNKPCLDENSTMCQSCLDTRIGTTGQEVGYNEWGDSLHFKKRQE